MGYASSLASGKLKAGSLVDERFELVRPLGRGSTAVVWLARDQKDQIDVALKLMHRHMLHQKSVLESVRREISALEALDHRGIARPITFSLVEEMAYVAMELVDGVTLDRWLGGQEELIPPRDVLSVMEQLTDAVEHAHRKFIVHRDLKPHNIALEGHTKPRPTVKILDFGVARFLDGGLFDATTQGRRIGSLFYMSPEQYVGERADERSDVFSLGAILFELLTIHRAWPRGPNGEAIRAFTEPLPRTPLNAIHAVADRICTEPRPLPSTIVPELPNAFDEIARKSMAIRPDDRHQTVSEFRDDVLPALRALDSAEVTRLADLTSAGPTDKGEAIATVSIEAAATRSMEPPADGIYDDHSGAVTDGGQTTAMEKVPTHTITQPVPPRVEIARWHLPVLIALIVGSAALVVLIGVLALSF